VPLPGTENSIAEMEIPGKKKSIQIAATPDANTPYP
jgi:hypothetical protein